jgi:hypothetical protein
MAPTPSPSTLESRHQYGKALVQDSGWLYVYDGLRMLTKGLDVFGHDLISVCRNNASLRSDPAPTCTGRSARMAHLRRIPAGQAPT